MNTLKHFIKAEFGTNTNFAKFMNATPQSVGYWININPRMILRHLPEIKVKTGKTYEYIVNVVCNAEEDIRRMEQTGTQNATKAIVELRQRLEE